MPNFLGNLIANYKPVQGVDPTTGAPIVKRPNFFQGLLTGGDAYRQANNLQQALALEGYRQKFQSGEGAAERAARIALENQRFGNEQTLASEQAKRTKEQTAWNQAGGVSGAIGQILNEQNVANYDTGAAPFAQATGAAIGRNELGAQDLRSQKLNNEMQIAADPLSVQAPLSSLQTSVAQDKAKLPMLQAQAAVSPQFYGQGLNLEQDILRSNLAQQAQAIEQARMLGPLQRKLMEATIDYRNNPYMNMGGRGIFNRLTGEMAAPYTDIDQNPMVNRQFLFNYDNSNPSNPVDFVKTNGISGRIIRKQY